MFQGEKAGYFISENEFYVYHGGESSTFREKYETDIIIIAYQEGDMEYNPAENVSKTIHIIGDVLH